MKRIALLLLIALTFANVSLAEDFGFLTPSDKLQGFVPGKLKSIDLSAVGSDAMEGVMSRWMKAYQQFYPKAQIRLAPNGSAAAPAALMDGSADIGPMARPMRSNEHRSFRARFGFEPTVVPVAYSAIGIYVSEKNPLQKITLSQLDAIYSSAMRRGLGRQLNNWSDLKAGGAVAGRKIQAVGLVDDALAAGFFKQKVLVQADFRPEVEAVGNASAVFQMIKNNPAVIGFAALAAPPAGVRLLAVSRENGQPAVVPSQAVIESGAYPLSRSMSFYLVRDPAKSVKADVQDFVRFVLSREGQSRLPMQGLIPLSPEMAAKELAKLN